MKQLLIKIPDELHAKLSDVPNKSEFCRNAIEQALSGTEAITEQRVIDLIKEHAPIQAPMPQSDKKAYSSVITPKGVLDIPGVQKGTEFTPKPPDPEFGYPCCKGIAPCKHWLWDENEALWKNTLTGKMREE